MALSSNPASLVDPFIGVDGAGECLCGPYLPFSLVRVGPVTLPPSKTNSYDSTKPILGFSQTHVSGTGGQSRYGNCRLTPITGVPRLSTDGYERSEESAEPGYYRVGLRPAGILAELTSTPRVGVHRFTFTRQSSAHVIVDACAVTQPHFYEGDTISVLPTSVAGYVERCTDYEVIGSAILKGGWGHGYPYQVHFYIRFNRPINEVIADRSGAPVRSSVSDGPRASLCISFGDVSQVEARVGISYTSIAKARASVDRECGAKTFDEIRASAFSTWSDTLARIRVEGGSSEDQKLFYTLFSRLVCMPSDLGIDDEFNQWHSGVRHFSDYYCLWDSVRNANSLLTLVDPQLEVDMLNCLLDVGDKIGWLPDAWIAGHSAHIQGGSSADILICEAALKGLKGIDYERALLQMRKNNEVKSPDPSLYGRYLSNYLELGYLSTDVRNNCVSRTLEYAYQDWCIASLAEFLGQGEVAARYLKSSSKCWNLWRDDLKLFAPRRRDGSWVEPFDPSYMLPDCWNDPYFYEGTSWQWSWNVQHDFPGLVQRVGGKEAFAQHLDTFFESGYYSSKETMLHVPYLYLYGGRPDKTAERVRWAIRKHFDTGRAGLRDNEDMGCQSAFFMCSSMGLYPLMGQTLYWLTTPMFERTELRLGGNGKSLVISAPGAGDDNLYVASARIDGKPLDRPWVRHHEIENGATIEFELSKTPTDWGKF